MTAAPPTLFQFKKFVADLTSPDRRSAAAACAADSAH